MKKTFDDYNPYLGLTDAEKAVVIPLNEAGKLSHKLYVDRENKEIHTIGVHMETGVEYIQRRRPMSEMEKLPSPQGFM